VFCKSQERNIPRTYQWDFQHKQIFHLQLIYKEIQSDNYVSFLFISLEYVIFNISGSPMSFNFHLKQLFTFLSTFWNVFTRFKGLSHIFSICLLS